MSPNVQEILTLMLPCLILVYFSCIAARGVVDGLQEDLR